MKALLGRKLGMVQITTEAGDAVAVTLIQAGPCTVTQVKTSETDGYDAVQVGFEETKKQTKPEAGHTKKANSSSRTLSEFRRADAAELKVGDTITADSFSVGDKVKVTGTSKGKGFAGTVKRHNFNTGPKSHGSSNIRKPGSIGSMYPQKIFKGKKMAGQMGGKQASTLNVSVALVDIERNIIGLQGSVPGPRKALVRIEEGR